MLKKFTLQGHSRTALGAVDFLFLLFRHLGRLVPFGSSTNFGATFVLLLKQFSVAKAAISCHVTL